VCNCADRFFGTYCAQKYKTKWAAFLYEFFIGYLGAGLFYLGFVTGGVFQLLFLLVCCFGFICGMVSCVIDGLNSLAKIGFTIFCVSFTTVFIWWLCDWIMILTGSLSDSGGNPLYDGLK
jgi:hypothetical protein